MQQGAIVVIPDSNFWISRTGEAEVIKLRDQGLIKFACSDDIAEECITHGHSQARAALFKRIDQLCDLWLDKKSIVVDDLILRSRNPEYQPRDVILHSLNMVS